MLLGSLQLQQLNKFAESVIGVDDEAKFDPATKSVQMPLLFTFKLTSRVSLVGIFPGKLLPNVVCTIYTKHYTTTVNMLVVVPVRNNIVKKASTFAKSRGLPRWSLPIN